MVPEKKTPQRNFNGTTYLLFYPNCIKSHHMALLCMVCYISIERFLGLLVEDDQETAIRSIPQSKLFSSEKFWQRRALITMINNPWGGDKNVIRANF